MFKNPVPGDHFVSAHCAGESCGMCRRDGRDTPATHKLGELIPIDDTRQIRHNATQYVCCRHFAEVIGHATAKAWTGCDV